MRGCAFWCPFVPAAEPTLFNYMSRTSAKFKTPLLMAGTGSATGFVVPRDVVEGFGKGKKPPVRVTINGYTYRNTVAVMGGKYMIGVAAEHRAKAKVAGGDNITVMLELDDAPRDVAVPADLARALTPHAAARKFFDALSFTYRKEIVRSLEDAKTDETRLRRLEKAVANLRAGKRN